MQKKTEEAQLALQDYFDVDWFSMKCYMRRQIAKCVNECKTQAANAKKIVGTIKHHRSKRKQADGATANGEWDSEDDYDYWDSDFDEDFDDEPDENEQLSENSSITNNDQTEKSETQSSPVKEDPVVNGMDDGNVPKKLLLPSHSIQSPAHLPTTTCSSAQVPVQRSTIPRAPIKRPQSGPPPPPIPQPQTQEMAVTEDYEVPISHSIELVASSLSNTNALSNNSQGNLNSYKAPLNHTPMMVNGSERIETYEIIEPEENYEVVQGPPIPVKPPEKPNLPPRLPHTSITAAPPPLPLKPKKLQDNLSSINLVDGSRSLNRPKLPTKPTDDDTTAGQESNPISGLGSSILSSFLGRRNSNSSSSLSRNHHSRDRNSSDSILSVGGSNTSLDGQSVNSSLEKDGFFTVGGSAFINCTASVLTESKVQSQRQEELGSSMATRPLPPVPQQMDSKSVTSKQNPLTCFVWFHEIEREDAEHLIKEIGSSGAFVVRPSKRAGKENPYTLTILHGCKVFHLNIRLRSDDTFALGKEKRKEKSFPTVCDLISYHQKEPILLTSRGECAGQTILGAYPEKTN